MAQTKVTTEILNAAIMGFEVEKTRIDAQIAEIRQMLQGGGAGPAARTEIAERPKRKISAAARRRMAAAQRARWAAVRKASAPQPLAAKKSASKKAATKKAAEG